MKLSIIIPAYNSGVLLNTAVDSIVNQPFQDWELIIVDDGSIDRTPQLANEIATRDNRIKVIHSCNQGAYKARLLGVDNAKGEFIMFMDSDDTITSECISGLFEYVRNDIDIVVGTINLNNEQIYQHHISGLLSSKEYFEALLLSKTSIGPCAKLFRRSLFRNIAVPKIRITLMEDLLLLLSLAKNARNVFVSSNLVCYNYIFRDNSARMGSMAFNQWQELFDLTFEMANNYNNPMILESVAEFKLNIIKNCMILRGLFVNSSEPIVRDLMSMSTHNLSSDAKQTLAVLKSPIKQKILYVKKELVLKTKRTVKFILQRK